tara:strand:- start:13 stop:540 length:528 start_codon:yes stop_codon:yes gene_type:complete
MHDTSSNQRPAFLHTNSNIFYILNGDANQSGTANWSKQNNNKWPMELHLNTNDCYLGGLLNVHHTIYAGNNITAFSDIRLKENIKPIENAIEKVSAINGVTFTRIDDEEDIKYAGLIAQEVEEVLPEVIRENRDGYKTLDYGNVTGLLVEAIKDLKEEINTLREEVNDLRSQIGG